MKPIYKNIYNILWMNILQPKFCDNLDFSPDPSRVEAMSRVSGPREESSPKVKLLIASAMLWSTPQSPQFRKGYRPTRAPDFTSSGFYGNAPLIPADDEWFPANDDPHFPTAFFRDISDAGVDAVDHCFFDDYPADILFATAEAARRSGTGIRVFPMMDQMPVRGADFLAELAAHPDFETHPNLLRVDGDRLVVFSFDVHGAEAWRERLRRAGNAAGKFFIVSDTMIFGGPVPAERVDELRPEIDPVHGLFCFADLSHPAYSVLGTLQSLGAEFEPRKIVGGCVIPGYIGSTRQGIVHDPRGTEMFRLRWLDCIERDADFVYLTTLNDYTEATEQECSANSTFALLDLTKYFSARWKSGAWPELAEPQAVLSYRKSVVESEAIEFELVCMGGPWANLLSAPDDRIAVVELHCADRQTVTVYLGSARALPGHLEWRAFLPPNSLPGGWVRPELKLRTGSAKWLTTGLAPFAVVTQEEEVSRRWLHVPVHRVSTPSAKVHIEPADSGARQISITGLDWENVSCVVLEKNGNPLGAALPPMMVKEGFVEDPYTGAGWCPMPYKDGMERLRRTPRDRYSAVVRLKDGSISFPEPAEIRNRPPMRDGLVFDLDLDSDTPTDRGWLQRDITKGPDQSKPAIVNDEGIPILTFDGERDAISVGPMLMPPVTASVECVFRTSDLSCNRTLFDSSEPILSLVLLKGGKVRLSRLDTWRREVAIESRSPLRRGAWHHLLASFDGDLLSLFIDGKLAAPRMHMRGTRSDKESTLGGPALWSEGVRAGHHFAGDIREFRVFQRTFDDADVAARAALNLE